MNEAHADSVAPGLAGPRPAPQERAVGWSRQKWLILVAVVFAAQLALILVFGERQFPSARIATNVPRFTVADNSSELTALDDPTLFVLPHARSFAAGVWRPMPILQPSFHWAEPSGELPLPAADNLGATFAQFMKTNRFAELPLDFKPSSEIAEPKLLIQPVFAENSLVQIEGDLAQRKLLNAISLTNWPYSDMIAPSRVQVLVNMAGAVVSAVLLPAGNGGGAANQYAVADQRALEIARSARFAPGTGLTIGLMIFNWRTVPAPAPDVSDRS